MWSAIGAALKKIAASALTSKKGVKVVVGIILGLIIVVISPVLVITALFGGYEKPMPDFFKQNVMNKLDEEQFDNIVLVGDTMTSIETKMVEAGYTENDIESANLIYTTTLYRYATEDGFVDRFITCFADNQTDADLIRKVNETFGTALDEVEFREILGRDNVSNNVSTEHQISQNIPETGG